MMHKILVILVCLAGNLVLAHDIHSEEGTLRQWSVVEENTIIEGSFYMFRDGNVYIERPDHQVIQYPLSSFSEEDQMVIVQKVKKIEALNNGSQSFQENDISGYFLGMVIFLFLTLTILVYFFRKKKQMRYVVPILIVVFCLLLYGFSKRMLLVTDPAFINSAFEPFSATVGTSYDLDYFYVHSKGIPDHEMMVGISNQGWQQQVPIPQCYIDDNAWSIPLNPVIASTPVPVNANHFTRGAIAIAANGIPIFNPFTNAGVDAFEDGQLDVYGGHSGRADDYHYHIAPLHLISLGQTSPTLPIAFGFDGFAVYGGLEPDGTAMQPLDANHGHYFNGVYHYHGTTEAPYMIGNMVGEVTEDATLQIVPQAQASPVRTENWEPLAGALITSCDDNGTDNGYNLSYTLNGVPGYGTNYSWDASGTYTFDYVTPAGTTTIDYNGFTQCDVPLSVTDIAIRENRIIAYPNPFKTSISIENTLGNEEFILIDSMGKEVYSGTDIERQNFSFLARGIYFLKINGNKTPVIKLLKE